MTSNYMNVQPGFNNHHHHRHHRFGSNVNNRVQLRL